MAEPSRKLLFSVTINDCIVQAFTVGGPGGGGKDTSNSGARVVHRASGAVGECREHRSHQRNRREAFLRMRATKTFQTWHRIETARRLGEPSVDQLVDASLHPNNLKTEVRRNGRWVVVDRLDGE